MIGIQSSLTGLNYVKSKNNIFIGCSIKHIKKAYNLVIYIDVNEY